jgi:lipoate-protein ligase B
MEFAGERKDCLLYNIERISYANALAIQHQLHERCAAGDIPGVLILLEHDPVITAGVRSSTGNVLVSKEILQREGVELVETDRGGDVTYHGPGQIVGYPIVRLREVTNDLHSYLRGLEESIILALARFGLVGERNGPAGVWVGGKKICSIGVAVRKWVTYHGFALNVNPDMSHFSLINPCGLDVSNMTNMAALLGEIPRMEDVRAACASGFSEVFGVRLTQWQGECLER